MAGRSTNTTKARKHKLLFKSANKESAGSTRAKRDPTAPNRFGAVTVPEAFLDEVAVALHQSSDYRALLRAYVAKSRTTQAKAVAEKDLTSLAGLYGGQPRQRVRAIRQACRLLERERSVRYHG